MNTRICLCLLTGLFTLQTGMAQKEQKQWAPGLFGSVSAHYSAFQQPLRKEVSPYVGVPGKGPGFQLEGGIALRNHLGLKLLIGGIPSIDLEPAFEKELEAQNPGYYADYISNDDLNDPMDFQVAFGLTYAFPIKKGWLEPEIMYGGSQISSGNAHVRLKKAGNHDIMVVQYRPVNSPPLAPTLFLGGRVCRYISPWFGVFAHVRGMAVWYNLDYLSGEELAIFPTSEDYFTVKKTALGIQAGAGIFLQIGRWGDGR